MADFRKWILAFAAIAIATTGAVQKASAQTPGTFACVASVAVPPLLRSEGLTEATGDVVLNCTGGVPTPAGQPIPQVNIQVFLNTAITSRLYANNASEAVLMIDEPGPTAQSVCAAPGNCSIAATGAGGGAAGGDYTGGAGRPNVFQGLQVGSNSIAFLGVPIDQPGAAGGGATSVPSLVLRITNIRANANALGTASANAPPTPVIETISISGSTSVPIANANQTVGFVARGLGAPAISSISNFQQCNGLPNPSGSLPIAGAFVVQVAENFATATKVGRVATIGSGTSATFNPSQSTPGTINNTESMTTLGTGPAPGSPGLADYGTRIRFVFSGITAGATIYVPLVIGSTNGTSTVAPSLIADLVTSDTGAFAPAAASSNTGGLQAALTTATGGVATAIYEIITSNPFLIETIQLPVSISFTASPSTNSPGLTAPKSTVGVSYAPVSTVTTASTTASIPRFADTATPVNTFAINTCATNLLFPFVTNIAGFDTGLAISSTSMDPFGTPVQTGTCKLNFYGSGAPGTAFTTPTIAGGSVYTNLASTLAAGFQGYIIAQCNFQYAHGFAFVTDGFGGPGRGLSQGYLALVIPDVNSTSLIRQPSAFGLAPLVGNIGEILAQ